MDKYAELREALEVGPTPGPWEGRTGGLDCGLDTDCAIHTWERCIAQIPDNPLNQRDMAYIAACHPEAIRALLAERDMLETEVMEQARLNGMGSEREARLMAERDAFREFASVFMLWVATGSNPARLDGLVTMARAALAQEQEQS